MALLLLLFLGIPVVLLASGVGLPWPVWLLAGAGILVGTGWLFREAYLDARSRDRSRWGAMTAAVRGVLMGWWSTGL